MIAEKTTFSETTKNSSASSSAANCVDGTPTESVVETVMVPLKKYPLTKVKFSWTLVNFWLDAAMLVVFLALVCVSTVIRFVFPAASIAQGWSLWGWGMDAWMAGQFALLAVLSLGILVHLMLHWSWVCGVFFGKIRRPTANGKLPDDGTRTIYGVGFMILLLNVMGLAIAAAAICVRSPL